MNNKNCKATVAMVELFNVVVLRLLTNTNISANTNTCPTANTNKFCKATAANYSMWSCLGYLPAHKFSISAQAIQILPLRTALK